MSRKQLSKLEGFREYQNKAIVYTTEDKGYEVEILRPEKSTHKFKSRSEIAFVFQLEFIMSDRSLTDHRNLCIIADTDEDTIASRLAVLDTPFGADLIAPIKIDIKEEGGTDERDDSSKT